MDRGIPSLDRGLTARSDRRLRGGRLGIFGFAGRQEPAAYLHERCPIFRQLYDQELTKRIRLAAKSAQEYKCSGYKTQN